MVVLVGEHLNGALGHVVAGRVDENVDALGLGDDALKCAANALAGGNVALDSEDASGVVMSDLVDRLGDVRETGGEEGKRRKEGEDLTAATEDVDMSAGLGVAEGNAAANAGATTGDDGDLAGEGGGGGRGLDAWHGGLGRGEGRGGTRVGREEGEEERRNGERRQQ